MRKRRAGLAVLFWASLGFAFSLAAQQQTRMTIGSMLARAREAGGRSIFIPAAGNVQGANGTHFRSDVTLIHYGSGPQKIAVGWMPAGSNNCDAEVAEITLNQGWVHFDDFVGQTLGKSGLGALLFMPIREDGEPDEVQIDGLSRIWTPLPNGLAGSGSQQLPAATSGELLPVSHVYLFGLRQDQGFRTNIGIANFDLVPHTWTAELFPAAGTRPADVDIIVPPCSMWQGAIPPGNFGPLLVHLLPQDVDGKFWSAYGSSIDNRSGDGWVVSGRHAF